jgi:Beta-carotene isomerase D27-like, C-terminal
MVETMVEKEIYHDAPLDRLFIWIFSQKMAKAVGKTTKLKGYDGFVDLSKKIMQGRNAKEQQAVVAKVLSSLVPSPILTVIRTVFSPTRWVCESNAWFAARLFEWLVGPCEVREVEVVGSHQQVARQKSGVHMKKCRYLEQSGCVGMCINMCKLPTQAFFTEGFGIPVTMTPNFEDMSCDMVFGQIPSPLHEEAAYQQPCLVNQCGVMQSLEPCPKVRES